MLHQLQPEITIEESIAKFYQYLKIAPDPIPHVQGKLIRNTGLILEVQGCRAPLGSRCLLETIENQWLNCEVVGFTDEKLFLMSLDRLQGIAPGMTVLPLNQMTSIPVGDYLLGRILDGNGNPLDDLPMPEPETFYPLYPKCINPLARQVIDTPIDVGVKAINALMPLGCGQRVGLFAGSGVGKSMLMGMMGRYTSADVTVVALIGERSREVNEFIHSNLGKEGLRHSVVVATPASESPLMRLNAAFLAMTIAEYFRDQGKQVLFLMDSLTRFAQAQREIALAVGEPPATKGYTPSVFAKLPELVERAGMGVHRNGSITGIFTVLAEGDDQNDPIVDAARSILDGHIVLSRHLADSGHFPAIDVERSVSRVLTQIAKPDHLRNCLRFKRLYSHFQENKDLITLGAYAAGSDKELDKAIQHLPDILSFLQQDLTEKHSYEASLEQLSLLISQMDYELQKT